MLVRIVPSTPGAPAGKLADAEICFEKNDGCLAGLKLVGFAVWNSKTGAGRNVTLPARQYSVNGERRSYFLLRAADGATTVNPLRERILQAYADYEEAVGPVTSVG